MRRHVVLATLLLLAAGSARAQETVLLRVGGQPGQSNRYQGGMDMFIRGGPMAGMMNPDTTLPMMRITTFTTRTVTAIAGDTAVLAEAIDSARAESPAMPQMSGMFGAMAAGMAGTVTTSRVDVRGRVYSSSTTVPTNAMPGGGAGSSSMNSPRPMYLLPTHAVRVGDTWTDSAATAATATDPATNLVATFTLTRLGQVGSSRVAAISVNGSMAIAGPDGTNQLLLTGEFTLDVTSSRLVGAAVTLTGTMSMPQMGAVPVKITITQALIS